MIPSRFITRSRKGTRKGSSSSGASYSSAEAPGSGKLSPFANIGVERIFPLASPFIEQIDVNKIGHVRRSRIFYLRGRTGKKARIQEKRITLGGDNANSNGKENLAPAENGEE